ncbi:MBL fold metallo-hydrolase [Desulfatirhabdium butyrativorans]|uniref:MBL fold metallo-hydrolase n=1 Tax=Desulfatirhabdium butyrativorans TaxID=340467 RepID=UPI0003FFF8E8|nr:MBL fold metallo-hydrolase [Desulfatirhabdium butyrativorans]
MQQGRTHVRPIQVAEGIYWVGVRKSGCGLSCNPYLIVEGDKAVLIDAGSRSDFAFVMMNILQVGIDPAQIVALIYQHYDPDLCGSMSNLIDMCENPALQVISESSNNTFISYYIPSEKTSLITSIDTQNFRYDVNGRILRFILTPYAHNPGSFVTYDETTRTLFSSDLFGCFGFSESLFLEFDQKCHACTAFDNCPQGNPLCPMQEILSFHRRTMPSCKSLRYAMRNIKELDIQCVASQHGGILRKREDIAFVINQLELLEEVGIDGIA